MESAENVDQLSCQVACSRVLQREVACLHLGDCVKRHLHGHPRGEVNSHVRSGSVNSHPECGCLHVRAWKRGKKPSSLYYLSVRGALGFVVGLESPWSV